jgi:hypothetical protein
MFRIALRRRFRAVRTYRELPIAASRTDVREAQEVEGRWLPLALPLRGRLGNPPEYD